jgi:Arc/MetJ-type ribon-helix-helix transcriptional regulator
MRALTKATVFLDPKLHEDLKIRIHYDGFKSQSEFIRACIVAYLGHDKKFMDFLDHYRADEKLQSKAQIRKSASLRRTGEQLVEKMGISEEEIENIFDLLEEEIPEL